MNIPGVSMCQQSGIDYYGLSCNEPPINWILKTS